MKITDFADSIATRTASFDKGFQDRRPRFDRHCQEELNLVRLKLKLLAVALDNPCSKPNDEKE